MISLKRNSKLELIKAPGRRTKDKSIYKPHQKEDFKISRGKFDAFLTCPKCFYMDRVVGLAEPSTPGWTLNSATDELLKKEFDECRRKQIPHRLFNAYGLGLYGELERYQLYFVVVTVWIINISFSVWWLKRYSLGPMEWIWRMLTYWKRIPIRR